MTSLNSVDSQGPKFAFSFLPEEAHNIALPWLSTSFLALRKRRCRSGWKHIRFLGNIVLRKRFPGWLLYGH